MLKNKHTPSPPVCLSLPPPPHFLSRGSERGKRKRGNENQLREWNSDGGGARKGERGNNYTGVGRILVDEVSE